MISRTKLPVALALLLTLFMTVSVLANPVNRASAAGTRLITNAEIGDFSAIEGDSNGTIAGAPYKYAILIAFDKGYVTLFTHKFPGYNAFTVAVGVPDGSNLPGTESLLVTVDGTLFKTITKSYGQAATQLTVPFGHASQIKLTMRNNQKKGLYILLGNPSVTTTIPKAVATPEPISGGNGGKGSTGNTSGSGAGKTSLKLFSASVSAGGQETALITTGHGATLTVVITYPNGKQQVLGPKNAGADGNFAYTWTIPTGVTGVAHVTVVSYSTVASSTFTVQ